MTITDFECLEPREKGVVIFEAKKLTERIDELVKVELFHFDTFYIEIKTSRQQQFKRTINTYTLQNLPPEYALKLLAIPIVVAD